MSDLVQLVMCGICRRRATVHVRQHLRADRGGLFSITGATQDGEDLLLLVRPVTVGGPMELILFCPCAADDADPADDTGSGSGPNDQ